MLFPRLTTLLFLATILLTLNTPAASAHLEILPRNVSQNTPKGKPYKHPKKEKTKAKRARGQDKAPSHALRKEKDSWCAQPPKFPIGRPVNITIPTPSGDRHFALYIPFSYENRKKRGGSYTPVALQLLFHGLGDECHNFLDRTGFIRYAEKDGYILVSACGSWGWFGRAWNAGTCCGFIRETPDDVAFALQIVEYLTGSACIDRTKVFATGFSNGGMLSEVLACEAPDVFRAVASVSGVVEIRPGNEEGLKKCTAAVRNHSSRASVLMIHGDHDPYVPWDGFHPMGFPPIANNSLGWALRNGCNEKNAHMTFNTTDFTNLVYDDCSPDRTRDLDDELDSSAFSPAIYSANEEGSQNASATSIVSMLIQGIAKNHNFDVQLSKEEIMFQRKAFLERPGPFAPSTPSKEKKKKKGRKAKSKIPPLTVELVRGIGYRHHWYETENFSTTDYIYRFGLRVFGSY